MSRVLRPDTGFVLYLNAFTHKVDGGYCCQVFEGKAHKVDAMLSGADALAHLAAHPATVIDVQHV